MAAYTVTSLLRAYRTNGQHFLENSHPVFIGTDGEDVYNPSYPLEFCSKTVLPARVERRDSETSKIVLFGKGTHKDEWTPVPEVPFLQLQDPCWIPIGNRLLLGGVQVDFSPAAKVLGWKTVFYSYEKSSQWVPFFIGPAGMKDLRFCILPNNKIAVFSRPIGGVQSGRGQIGFIVLDSLQDLTIEAIESAPLLGLFTSEEWGGVNQVQVLQDGSLGVLGHIACYSADMHRHYYPMAFVLDPATGKILKEPSIIAERQDLLPGPSKRADLVDVLFPGGCILEGDKATLYLGVGDAEVQTVTIENPFN
ncbi:MAG: DUF1861 family protein [Treponema sp.]|jgi:hypothetical protein|nr:DUF1861 family protein [Treponema sp.]